MPRAGIITVVGKPNAGKSTLLNRVIGEKLAIVSEKPQSTRDRVVGIRTANDVQMIILDTPGLLNPRYELQRAMRGTALRALKDADVIVYLADAGEGAPPPLEAAAELSTPPHAPVWLVLNKADTLTAAKRADLAAAFPHAHLISARTGEGVEDLFQKLGELLPESPFLYPDDEISTASSSLNSCGRPRSSSCRTRCPMPSRARWRSFGKRSHRYTFGRYCTSSATARSESSSAPAVHASVRSARPRVPRWKPLSARRCIWISG
jgi:small GTP-binding protein